MPTGKMKPCQTSAVCNALMNSKLARSALAATALLCSLHMAHGASAYPVDMCVAFFPEILRVFGVELDGAIVVRDCGDFVA